MSKRRKSMALASITRGLATGVAATALMLCVQPASAGENFGSLQGMVKNAAGQPVSGAFVRLKNADKRLTFMVISQNGGTFTANDLPAGNYTVQAIEGKNQSAISAAVAVATGKASKIDVALTNARGPMLAAAWPDRIPEDKFDALPKDAKALPEGQYKQLVAEKCTVCHDVQRILG